MGAGRAGDAHSLRRRPEEAAIAAEAFRTLLPGMVCLCLTFPLCSILQGVGKAAVPVVCMLAGVGVKLLGNLVLIPRPASASPAQVSPHHCAIWYCWG